VLGFGFGLALVTVLLFGLYPALQSTRPDTAAALNEAAARSSGCPPCRA
jgi:ABC-type antimicrobial peptide transport system permease subunit